MTGKSADHVVRSVCRICHGGCGTLVTVRDNRVIKVTGDPESPMSKGWMCIKGMHSVEIANHPDRLTKPLRRRPGKSGSWQEIPWDDALAEIAGRMAAIRQEHGPESIALGQGTGRHHYLHVIRFANALVQTIVYKLSKRPEKSMAGSQISLETLTGKNPDIVI